MYDISKKKDAKVSRSSNPTDYFYKTGHLIRTVESKKAGYFIDLPVINAIVTKDGKTSLSDTALDILYNTVLYEINRIARVNKEIETGKDINGNPVKEIIDYNEGALRGLKLYETGNMLGNLAADIEKNAVDPNYVPDREAILEQLNTYWMGQVNRLVDMMIKEGLVSTDNKRILAPSYLFKGFGGKNANLMNEKMYLIKNNFMHNISQVFMNDFLNTSAVNKLLHGDESKSFKLFVEQVKRAAGANAAGPSIESIVTKDEWGISHKLTNVYHVTYKDTEFLKRSGEKGEQDDGQMYCTVKGLRYMLFGMGTLKQVQVDILNKIERGDVVTKEEFFKAGGIQDMKAAFNPLKMVYFDGKTYLKCSVQMLSKEFTSYWSKTKGKWVAYPGKENLHNIRLKLENFEKKNETITFAHPVQVSKGMKKAVASSIAAITDKNFNKLPADYMRQQLENPSGKLSMTDPTQKLQQIFAEIPANSTVYLNGKKMTGKEAVDNYLDLIAKRAAINYKMKRNGIFDIKDAFNEISMSYQTGQVTAKLAKFYDLCYENLMATGADAQTLEFFRTKDGEVVYDLNFPATLPKYTQLFLAYFSSGAFQAKVPGLTLTLISNAHHKTVKRLISVDEQGQPKEWEVITREMFDADPEKYTKSLIQYTQDDDGTTLKRMFTGLEEKLATGKPVYYLDDLRDNVGIYNSDGERIETYSEYITASHYEEEDSAVESSFSVRIPSDDKHSYMNARRVDVLPVWMGSTAMFPQEIMEKSGTDFDLDKVYVSIPDTYAKDDKRVAYGSATTDAEKFEEYVTWQYNNNKAFKNNVKASMKEDASLTEVIKEKAELNETQSQLISKILQADRDIQKEKQTKHLLLTASGYISAKGIYLQDFKDAKKAIVNNYNNGKKTADELEETIKATRDWHILKVLAEMKMPASVAQFNKEGGEEINPGVINNKVLESNQSLLSSEAVAGGENPILNQPTSTDAFKIFAETIKRELAGADSEYAIDLLNRITDKKEDTSSMLGKEISRDTNAQGRDNIGAAANAVINYSINSTFGLNLKGKKITIDGKEYNSYTNLKAWNGNAFSGERVFASLSAIENAMTDNAKFAYSGKYGLSIGAVGYLSNMVSQGIPFETAMLFIIQPTVQEYFRRISNLSSNLKTSEESSLSKFQIMQELEDYIVANQEEEEEEKEQEEEKGAEEKKKYDPTSREAMIDNIRNNKMSLEIFDILKTIDKQSMDLMEFSKILKITQGIPVSWEEFDDIKKAMNKFGLIDASTEEKDLSIDVKQIMKHDHKFMAKYIEMFRDLDALSAFVFVERNPQFMQVMDIVKANFDVPSSDKKEFNNSLKLNLLSYFSISAYKKYLDKEGLGSYVTSLNHAMIYPEVLAKETNYEDAIDIVVKLKKKFAEENTPNYFINYILNIVDAGDNVSKINKVEINSWAKLSPYQQEKIIDGYLQLYSNKDTHIDAVALFHYLLVKDGGQFKSGSFIRYIHNGVFKNLLNSTADVNRLLSDKTADDVAYNEVFGKTMSELVDGFLKSYATWAGNETYIKQTTIFAPVLKNKNSPIYLDRESKVLYVDYKMGMESVEVNEGDSKFMSRLRDMEDNGFGYEFEEIVYKDKKTGKDKKKKTVKISFPYSIMINNQLYILQAVDKAEPEGAQDFVNMLGVDQSIAKGSRARYIQGKLRGSKEQWGGAAVFGKMPIREEIVVRNEQVINNPPYSSDVPSGKNIVTKTQEVVNTGTKRDYDETAELGSIKNPYKAVMNFTDGDGGRNMKPEFAGKSTMDLILSGDRTGTTRDLTKDYNRLPVKTDDFIEFSDKLGRKALVRVTETWTSIKNVDAESWSDIEGWDKSVYNNLISKKEAQYKQLQFVLVDTEQKNLIVDNIEDVNDLDAINALKNQFGLFVYRNGDKFGIGNIATSETPQQMLKRHVDATEKQEVSTQAPISETTNTGIQYPNKPEFNKLPVKLGKPTMTYAGIGSRRTPAEMLPLMTELAKELAAKGYTLNSGAAEGADSAFEAGASTKKDIFPGNIKTGKRELMIAEEIHPNWGAMIAAAKRNAIQKGKNPEAAAAYVANLMARNTNQVFGKNLDTPVDFVLAYTPDNLTDYTKRTIDSGGTGQAIDMASRKGIPVINMAGPNWRSQLDAVINRQSSISETNVSLPTGEQMTDEQWETELAAIYKEKGDKKGRTETEWTKAAKGFRDQSRSIGATDEQILNTIKCL
jgi:hypothetical protein